MITANEANERSLAVRESVAYDNADNIIYQYVEPEIDRAIERGDLGTTVQLPIMTCPRVMPQIRKILRAGGYSVEDRDGGSGKLFIAW